MKYYHICGYYAVVYAGIFKQWYVTSKEVEKCLSEEERIDFFARYSEEVSLDEYNRYKLLEELRK